jgi:hypothetical protein
MLRMILTMVSVPGLLAAAGCQNVSVSERLDSGSGATLVTQTAPRVFAKSLPQYSRSARDYLYLGPVEINRQGERVYGLWVGLATTIDPRFLVSKDYASAALYIELNGELMALPLRPWDDWAPGLSTDTIYDTPLALTQQMVAVVTLDQLTLLAAANFPVVHLSAAGGRGQRYSLWTRDPPDWSAFVGRASGVEGRPGTPATARSQR